MLKPTQPRTFSSIPSSADMIDGSFIIGDRYISGGVLYQYNGTSFVEYYPVPEASLPSPSRNGLNAKRTARFTWDYTADGVTSPVSFEGVALPANSIIVGGRGYVKAALTGTGNAAIQIVGANDLKVAAAISGAPWSSATTDIAIVPIGTAGTDVVVASGGTPAMVFTGTPTAGHVNLFLDYIVTD